MMESFWGYRYFLPISKALLSLFLTIGPNILKNLIFFWNVVFIRFYVTESSFSICSQQCSEAYLASHQFLRWCFFVKIVTGFLVRGLVSHLLLLQKKLHHRCSLGSEIHFSWFLDFTKLPPHCFHDAIGHVGASQKQR